MKWKSTTSRLLQKGMRAVSIAALLVNTSSAAPIPLPDWVKPIESAMPKVAPDIISEMDEIRETMATCGDSPTPDHRKQAVVAAQRMVELGEQAGQAMIWQYFKEAEQRFPGFLSALESLSDDRELAAWLLPIVRHRVEWLEQALSEKRVTDLDKHLYEIFATEEYLNRQGEFEDIEKLNQVEDEFIKQGLKGLPERETRQWQLQRMREARKWSERDNQPYWQQFARRLISEGVLTADALKPRPTVQNPGDGNNRPKPLGPRKPLPDITPPTPFFQPWMVWSMGLFVIVVSAGLLGWAFRKPKKMPGKNS